MSGLRIRTGVPRFNYREVDDGLDLYGLPKYKLPVLQFSHTGCSLCTGILKNERDQPSWNVLPENFLTRSIFFRLKNDIMCTRRVYTVRAMPLVGAGTFAHTADS